MKNHINYISIDDSIVDQLMLREFASAFPFLKEMGNYNSPNDGLAAITTLQPDLVFLDIEMPGMTGVEVLRKIRQRVPIAVFITSHGEFALDGFELNAFDYILKPLTADRFRALATRLQEYWEMKQKAVAYEVLFEKEFLLIKEGYNQISLPIHEITYLEAMQDYTKIVTHSKNYLTLATLSAFLEKLPTEKFMRIHRSYAIALDKINRIAGNTIICGNATLPIGKTYRNEIAQLKF